MGTGKRDSATRKESKVLPVDGEGDKARLEFIERLEGKNIKVVKKDPRWLVVGKGNLEAHVLYFAEPSEHGINEGCISKLWMKDTKTEKPVVHYDRGWDQEPPSSGQARDFYHDIMSCEE